MRMRVWIYGSVSCAMVILFVASVARFYHPGTGFTSLIGFPAGHDYEVPAMRGVPHYDYADFSYDGQFYAQLALDPLLRDQATDRAMDMAPFRARRILFSWTAHALGLGRPAWILEAYALQNVVCWLILAALLTRWMPPTTGRGLALWSACLFSHGTLWSVRFALLDVPSLTLTTLAVVAVEKGRPLLSAVIIGIAGLGRETNLLALASQPIPRDRRAWARLLPVVFLAVLPMLIWLDYLRSIYRSTLLAHTDQLMLGTGLIKGWQDVIFIDVKNGGLFSLAGVWLCLLISVAVQAVYLLVRREYETPWWRVAIVYALLMVFLDRVLADPNTGAITRVLLPMTVGFNVLLASETRWTRFWPWFALGNLHLLGVATFKGL
ncbi:MAG: hypothetical protein H0W18_05635 [Acidobacteria bacterium]|nr:hypothetical protein [Acidobacteriota bacterium]